MLADFFQGSFRFENLKKLYFFFTFACLNFSKAFTIYSLTLTSQLARYLKRLYRTLIPSTGAVASVPSWLSSMTFSELFSLSVL